MPLSACCLEIELVPYENKHMAFILEKKSQNILKQGIHLKIFCISELR